MTDQTPSSSQIVTIVSGLPRSGTSMMMKMLEAGGLPPLTDNLRTADEDNPKGYYEFERVKQLPKGDVAWLPDAQGKVVKVIAALLPSLPGGYHYRVIFMQRAMPEVLASQRQMLIRRGEDPNKIPDDVIAKLFEKHLKQVERLGQPAAQRRAAGRELQRDAEESAAVHRSDRCVSGQSTGQGQNGHCG